MRIEVKVPQLPESVAEATLVNWHKKPGRGGQARREPDRRRDRQGRARAAGAGDGVLVEITRPDGSTVTSNDVIAVIDTEAKGAPPPRRRGAAPAPRAATATSAAASALPPRRCQRDRGSRCRPRAR